MMRKRLGSVLRRLAGVIDPRPEPVAWENDPRYAVAAIDRQTKAILAVGDMVKDQIAGGIPEAVNTICWRIVGPQLASLIDDTQSMGVEHSEILDTLLERLSNGWFSDAPRAR